MKLEAVATPLALVVAVVVFVLLANAPPGPLAGAVKVTLTPLTGLAVASVTVACRAIAKLELIVALCPDPAVVAMAEAVGAVMVNWLELVLDGPKIAPEAVSL